MAKQEWAPYQVLFPIGILSSLIAVGIWLFQGADWLPAPALFIHSKLIAGGFLWSFIAGFLMTAIPRMTGTRGAHPIEWVLGIALIALQFLFSWFPENRWFYGNQIALVLFLTIYGGRRVLTAKKPIPVFFSHVGVAMALAVLGSYYNMIGNGFMGVHLYHVGAVLLLVLGIGTRFFSFLSGLPSEFESAPRSQHVMFHVLGVLVGIQLYAAGLARTWAYLGLAFTTLIYMALVWRVFRKSQRPSPLKWGVRVVASMIPLTFFMCWLEPAYYIAWLHLLFIGCFALITYAVATRVTLAHGAYSINLEMKSPMLWVFLVCLSVSLVLRAYYGYVGGPARNAILHSAVLFWILSILAWMSSFALKILRPGDQEKPAC